MAFLISGWNRISSGANTVAPVFFGYKSTTDTLATIIASAYFNKLIQDLTNGVGVLKVGDVIFCQGSDSRSFTRVTAVTTNVTVSQFADISSIADGELTAAMTALAQGSLMLGNASGFGSALDLSAGGNIAIGNDTTAVALDMSGAGNIMVGDGTTAAALDLSAGGNIGVGNDTTVVALDLSGDAKIAIGNGTTITSVVLSSDVTMDNAGAVTIAAGAVDKAMLAATVRPSHMVVYAAQPTTTGTSATEAFTVTGALAASDYAFVQIVDEGTNTVTILEAVVTNDTLTITFSADPGNDAIFNYQLIRATS